MLDWITPRVLWTSWDIVSPERLQGCFTSLFVHVCEGVCMYHITLLWLLHGWQRPEAVAYSRVKSVSERYLCTREFQYYVQVQVTRYSTWRTLYSKLEFYAKDKKMMTSCFSGWNCLMIRIIAGNCLIELFFFRIFYPLLDRDLLHKNENKLITD